MTYGLRVSRPSWTTQGRRPRSRKAVRASSTCSPTGRSSSRSRPRAGSRTGPRSSSSS